MTNKTTHIDAFIKERYVSMRHMDIAKELGVTVGYIRRRGRVMGLKVPKEIADARRAEGLKKPFKPCKEDETIKQLYATCGSKLIAKAVGRSKFWVWRRIKTLGIELSAEEKAERSLNSRIKKGQEPFNKGKQLHEFMSEEGIKNSAKTRFKKGNVPYNTKQDGDVRLRRDKSGKLYAYVKLANSKWQLFHNYLWLQAGRVIPPGHVLSFINGDTLDYRLENLEVISRSELLQRNCINRYPTELRESIQLIRKIQAIYYEKQSESIK